MLNLATLSALLRTIRQQGGAEGAAGPVERIAHVRRIAADGEAQVAAQLRGDDAGGRAGAALRSGGSGSVPTGPGHLVPRTAGAAESAARAESGSPSASLDLTRGGALVSVALRARSGPGPQPARVDAPMPLVTTPRAGASELARALARSVADSGLFYESHLLRWTRREYPASALEREPQAGWKTTVDASAPAPPDAQRTVPLPETAVAVLTRQLDALDARQLAWSGALWPGQRATITLEEEDARADEGREDGESAHPAGWRTTIALDLPSLGPVIATLAMRGDRLDVALHAPAPDAQGRLADARSALAGALAESHIALRGFVVDA